MNKENNIIEANWDVRGWDIDKLQSKINELEKDRLKVKTQLESLDTSLNVLRNLLEYNDRTKIRINCEYCLGSGHILGDECLFCAGKGYLFATEWSDD